ncbi:hypothetical protein IMF27_02105 [Pseudomonas sp. PCH199]|uniref:hypothetical protein n=1 Tax=unclassified Pseudomonas TaxID=196821 RepID=UPI000BD92472|nr:MULTISPECIES: hypothetical protein [unclassified Pseudomonas]MCW8274640.1 hypothetical protein [Pseudomonas sp. PCH199]PAM85306.1 hypothetical protein CES87_02145 [Pseudomonas sp. ERMR1:02]
MRYLKVIAQDRSGSGTAETLRFEFYEDEQFLREATAAEILRLRTFGITYLKCAWFNIGEGEERHLRMFSLNPSGDGTPESVRLHFHEGPIIAYKAAVHDLDNDGTFEIVLCSDVDNDGRADRTDRTRVNSLVREFLKIEW